MLATGIQYLKLNLFSLKFARMMTSLGIGQCSSEMPLPRKASRHLNFVQAIYDCSLNLALITSWRHIKLRAAAYAWSASRWSPRVPQRIQRRAGSKGSKASCDKDATVKNGPPRPPAASSARPCSSRAARAETRIQTRCLHVHSCPPREKRGSAVRSARPTSPFAASHPACAARRRQAQLAAPVLYSGTHRPACPLSALCAPSSAQIRVAWLRSDEQTPQPLACASALLGRA
mmetsp:Transcript_7515/g.16433  ORF Transcript_7515/g.16433 Transcript_7515/m.16433 type:complete len:232 (+) Transcript_7515:147-842(+)